MKFDYKLKTLENGLRVVTVPMETPTVTVLAMVGVGSRYEDPKTAGISHFVEHLVFKGTKKYPTAQKVAVAVDAVGAAYNAFTSKEYTGFYVKAASEHAELAMDVLSQFLFAAKLRSEDIEREKGVIVEEINMYEDTPMRRIGDLFEQLLYRKTHLGRDIIGTRETVKGVKREDFLAHMNRWYGPGNIVLGVAGDRERMENGKRKMENLIREYFGRGTERTVLERTVLAEQGPSLTESKVKVHFKKTEQAHFALGARSLPRGHKDRYVQSVLATILGGNMSSRLFTEVREKRGLAYYVRTAAAVYHGVGHIVSSAGVTTGKIDEAVKAIMAEYQKVSKSNSIKKEELRRAKDYIRGKLLIDLEDSQDVALSFVDSLLLEGKVRTPQEILEGVEAVTQEQVITLAREILDPRTMNLVVIGPYKDEKEFQL